MFLPQEVLVEPYAAWVRASETGDLATVWDWDGAVKPDQLAIIVATVGEFGLFYVPTLVLNTPYTGRADPPSPPTWGERLFGYA